MNFSVYMKIKCNSPEINTLLIFNLFFKTRTNKILLYKSFLDKISAIHYI
jgi:hypothetical protein